LADKCFYKLYVTTGKM